MHKKVLKIVLIILVLVILGYVVSREWRQPVKLGQGVSPELKIAFDHGDFEQVIKLANDLLKQEPNNAYALLFLSQTYAQKGSLSFQEKELGVKALDYAKQASNLIPRDSRVYIAMGYAYEIMQNYQEAIKAYDQALTLEPNNVDALVHRGHTYDISGNLD